MRKLTLLLVLVICAVACTERESVRSEINRLEKRLESNPDSVLTALSDMDRSKLTSKSLKADYSLLLSNALDKNYIDVASDSIIAPAVQWYSKHGTPDKKLKTFYYRAIVAENGRKFEEAMEWLKRGEEFSESNPSIAGRLYKHKASLYYKMYYYSDALVNADKSADYFLRCQEYSNYMYRLLDVADIQVALCNHDEALSTLEKINEYWGYADTRLKADYYWTLLNIEINLHNLSEIEETIERCKQDLPDMSEVQYLRLKLSEAYLLLDDCEKAGEELSSYAEGTEDEYLENSFLLIMSEYSEKKGDFKSALDYFRRYNQGEAEKTKESLSSDMKFIEERYESEINEIKTKNREHTMVLTFFVFLAVCLVIIRYIKIALNNVRTELSETEINYKQVDEERKALMSIVKNSAIMDQESLKLINKRLQLLDKVLAGHLSQDPAVSKIARFSIENLMADKESFIQESSRVFCASRPKFAGYLKEHGLTEWEIGYCCLFLMGMYAKDLEPYFSVRTSNLINANIRKKLGIPANGQKLKSYLMLRFEEIEKGDAE